MYEYKNIIVNTDDADVKMNQHATLGWRIIAVSPFFYGRACFMVTYEREKAANQNSDIPSMRMKE